MRLFGFDPDYASLIDNIIIFLLILGNDGGKLLYANAIINETYVLL